VQLILYGLAILVMLVLGHVRWYESRSLWQAQEASLYEVDDARLAVPGFEAPKPIPTMVDSIADLGSVVWLRFELELEPGSLAQVPYGLFLSGLFSADAYWDGEHLGSKGQVGATKELERPGPIESIIYLPPHHTTPGRHLLALRISAFHVGYTASGLFHELSLGSFKTDPRRELHFYALPLLLSGSFLLLGLMFAFSGCADRAGDSWTLAAFSGFVLLQLGAEVSRSLVAYPYDWHWVRSFSILLLEILAGASLSWFVAQRTDRRRFGLVTLVLLPVAVSVAYLQTGFDDKTVAALWVLTIVPLVASLTLLARRRIEVTVIAAGLLVASWIVSGSISATALLDRSYYLTCFAFLTAARIWERNDAGPSSDATSDEPELSFFIVRSLGQLERIPVADVIFLRAVGNYAELVCTDGRAILHQDRLGEIMQHPPPGFLRVHRSFAINLSHIHSVKSRVGSRYRAVLTGGAEVPVSRQRVAELRQRMSTTPR
jgi:hypothetical protein